MPVHSKPYNPSSPFQPQFGQASGRLPRRRLPLGYYLLAVLLSVLAGIAVVPPPHVLPFAIIALVVLGLGMLASPMTMLTIYMLFSIGFVQEWVRYFYALPPFAERAVAFALIGSLLVSQVRLKHLSIRATPIGISLLVLYAAFAATVISAHSMAIWSDAMYDFSRNLVLFFAVVNIATTEKRIRLLTLIYTAIVVLLVLVSIKYYYQGQRVFRMGIWRAVGPGVSLSDPNAHGMTVVYMLPFLIALRHWWPGIWARLLWMPVLLAALWNIVLTGSRTAFIGVISLLCYYLIRSRRRLLTTALVASLVLLAAVVVPEQYLQRWSSTTDFSGETGASSSAIGRWQGLQTGLALLASSPVTGVGFGCFSVASGKRFGSWFSSHSLPGELLGETGLLGAAAFVLFLVVTFKHVLRLYRQLTPGRDGPNGRLRHIVEAIGVGMCLLILMGFAAHNLGRYNWYLFAGMLAAISMVGTSSSDAPGSEPS